MDINILIIFKKIYLFYKIYINNILRLKGYYKY